MSIEIIVLSTALAVMTIVASAQWFKNRAAFRMLDEIADEVTRELEKRLESARKEREYEEENYKSDCSGNDCCGLCKHTPANDKDN